jgi:NTE family protein
MADQHARVLDGSSVPPPGKPHAGTDSLAHARDFQARHGAGLHLSVSLGGGGLFFVAWQVSYLHEMAQRGIDLAGADRVVGTSAGALVAAVLEAGRLNLLYRELTVLAKAQRLLAALAPTDDLYPSQTRALRLYRDSGDADTDTIAAIGHAALAAQTPAASVMVRNVALILAARNWPSPALHITCADTYSGERCVITSAARIGIARAVAASSAVPGLFAPQPIGDRLCMDGGVSGSGTHLDLLAGSQRVVILALTDGSGIEQGTMTCAAGSIENELAALRSTGSEVFRRIPEAMAIETLMDPAAVPSAIAMGRRQAASDANELRGFLS